MEGNRVFVINIFIHVPLGLLVRMMLPKSCLTAATIDPPITITFYATITGSTMRWTGTTGAGGERGTVSI